MRYTGVGQNNRNCVDLAYYIKNVDPDFIMRVDWFIYLLDSIFAINFHILLKLKLKCVT